MEFEDLSVFQVIVTEAALTSILGSAVIVGGVVYLPVGILEPLAYEEETFPVLSRDLTLKKYSLPSVPPGLRVDICLYGGHRREDGPAILALFHYVAIEVRSGTCKLWPHHSERVHRSAAT